MVGVWIFSGTIHSMFNIICWKLKLGTCIFRSLETINSWCDSCGVYCLFNSICANCNNLKFVTSHVRMFKTVRTEMVKYVREMMLSGGVLLPTRGVIGKRIKRCYGSQRHQAHSKADKEKRRRQRFLNKRNCLTMVGLYYFSLSYSNALDQKKVHAC